VGDLGDDIEYDRDNTFLDTSGYGVAVSVTHKAALTGTTTAIAAVREEQFFAVFDDKEVQRYHVDPGGAVTYQRNDQIVDGSDTWTIVDLREEGPELLKLTCTRTYERT
jgi:hypothetical protein